MVAAGEVRLPVYPPVARQMMPLLRQQPANAPALAELIGHEPALTCSLFRAANSAFYQGLPKVLTVEEALTRLGASRTAQLLEELCRDSGAAARGPLTQHYLPLAWRHGLGCALGAGWLARRCGYHALAKQAHLAGLLHDVGKLFLLAILEQLLAGDEAVTIGDTLIEEILAAMHAGLGMELALAWNLPDELATVVGRHHEPDPNGQDAILPLVRLANQGCHKLGLGWKNHPALVLPTTAEAQFLSIDEIVLAEFEIMLEDRFGLVAAGGGN